MSKYQEALNRIKTAPSFMGGTDLYKTHLNSSELFLQDIATLQELVDKSKPKPVKRKVIGGTCTINICPHCKLFIPRRTKYCNVNYCPNCGQSLDWR